MATQKEIIEIEVKGTGKAVKQTNKLKDSVKGVGKEQKKNSEAREKSFGKLDSLTGGAITKFKGLTRVLGSATTGFKSLRVAIISSGIGAIVIGVIALIQAFKRSEEGQNKFAKILGVIGSVVGNVLDLFADLGEFIIDLFSGDGKAIQQAKAFGKKLFDVVGLPIKTVIDIVKTLGKVLGALFSGDVSGAFDALNEGVKDIKGNFTEAADAINGAKDALVDFTKEALEEAKIAGQIADARATADKLTRKLLVDRANAQQKIADLRFKSEQREKFSAQERVALLTEASKVAEDLANQEIRVAQIRLNARRQENKLTKSTKEDKDAEAQLEATLINLTTQKLNLQKRLQTSITTFNNEVKAERNKEIERVKKELAEAQNIKDKALEKEKEDELKRLESIKEIQDEFKALEEEEKAETELAKIELEQTRQLEELTRLNATEEQKANIILFFDKKIQAQKDKDRKIELKREKLLNAQKIEIVSNTLGLISGILGRSSKAGKAAAIAQSLINTYQGITAGVKLGYPAAIPAVIAAAATGFATVKKIIATKTPNPIKGGSGGSVAAPSFSASLPSIPSQPQAQSPSFNLTDTTGVNQLAQSIGGQSQQPLRTYVVASDVTTAQNLDNNIIESAVIG